jgi:hypothetical protein
MKMSETKSHFKIKNGEIEIEYEGLVEDVNQRYKEALDWLTSTTTITQEKKVSKEKGNKFEKEEKRGGAQKSIFSPKIDELINEGFFKLPNRKKLADVLKALQEKGLPVKGKDKAILIALKRRLGKTLKGTKTGDEWNFWTE